MPLDAHSEPLAVGILKNSLKLRSFIIEEVALADLLERAWRPVGKKIRKQLAGIVDFENARFSPQEALAMELWLTPEMIMPHLAERWAGIEAQVKRYLQKSYRRAWTEKGVHPLEVTKSEEDTGRDEWEEYLRDIAREGSTLDKEESLAAEAAITAALLSIAREQFFSYPEETVVPALWESAEALRKLHTLEQSVLSERAAAQSALQKAKQPIIEVAAAEASRKKAEAALRETARQLEALQKARSNLLGKLQEVLQGTKHAAGTANLTVARAHHFGFLDWAEANQVTYYQVTAVLDTKTCEACWDMNGKIFAVADALQFKKKFLSIFGDKELMKREAPFLTKESAKAARGYVTVEKDGEKFYFPPFHPYCRCTVFAVYSEVAPE